MQPVTRGVLGMWERAAPGSRPRRSRRRTSGVETCRRLAPVLLPDLTPEQLGQSVDRLQGPGLRGTRMAFPVVQARYLAHPVFRCAPTGADTSWPGRTGCLWWACAATRSATPAKLRRSPTWTCSRSHKLIREYFDPYTGEPLRLAKPVLDGSVHSIGSPPETKPSGEFHTVIRTVRLPLPRYTSKFISLKVGSIAREPRSAGELLTDWQRTISIWESRSRADGSIG